ncbi:MAG TPA: hypothetical protein VE262_15890 [Blastocatellia bacterium]|nr:hypothetical protein [Blastocatellia bacterium]
MNKNFVRHFMFVALLALFIIGSMTVAPGPSSAVTAPPGIVRVSSETCLRSLGCNNLEITNINVATCLGPPETFRFSLIGGTRLPRTDPPYLVSVKDPLGNPVTVFFNRDDFGRETFTFKGTLAGIYPIEVRDASECVLECAFVTTPCCTLTQEEYANSQFQLNDCNAQQIVKGLIGDPNSDCSFFSSPGRPSGPLTVGSFGLVPTSAELTFNEGSEDCIFQRLPASGSPTRLPAGLHEEINPDTCQTSPELPLNDDGKFRNELLGQAIALSLNTRLDFDIGNLALCNTMVTRKAMPRFGFVGRGGEMFGPGPDLVVTIPKEVIEALSNLDLEPEVDGLLELANRALSGNTELGGASLSAITAAIESINRGFNQCSYLVGCFDTDVCLQDDTRGDILSLNTATGEYQFTRCGPAGFAIHGKGTVKIKGNTLTLEHNSADRRVVVRIDTGIRKGTAAVQIFPQGTTLTITDRNTADNACACP